MHPHNQNLSIKEFVLAQKKPKKVVVTAGMPYANGPLHLGHLAGTHVPADIYARWMRMWIGAENVLYVNGNDDHGSTSEVGALNAGKTTRDFIDEIHVQQRETLRKYGISTDIFTGTSQPETYEIHKEFSQNFLRSLYKNGMLEKRVSKQWYDPQMQRFLQDRFVRGTCPQCGATDAFSDECESCGAKFDASELISPRSQLSDAQPVLKETAHWWLDMWKVADPLKKWIESKQKSWRSSVVQEVINTVLIGLRFENSYETQYKEFKPSLPPHKSRYVPGKKVECLFDSKADLERALQVFHQQGVPTVETSKWGARPITRDVSWGIPVPPEIDPEMVGKTLYVWPDSLIAPIVFTQVALQKKGLAKEKYKEFWNDPESVVMQFLGQDNVFFYVIMQGAMWIGAQKDISRLPEPGELQLTDIVSCFHLQVNGEKMSKSKGNFFTGNELLEKGYHPDQIRYFLAMLSLPVKSASFDLAQLEERNKFLAGPMNAAFEKPISACRSKYNSEVPQGQLLEKVEQETKKILQMYFRNMQKADYVVLLGQIENYARLINSLFAQFKPHDDRAPEQERKDALYSCFYVLKNLMLMLNPFAPMVMNELRLSLNLPETVLTALEFGTGLPVGHKINDKRVFFPAIK